MLFFEAKAKYNKIDEKSGKDVVVTETRILDAVSFTEAESIMFGELEKITSRDFSVESIAKSKISEIHVGSGDTLYKGTVVTITESDSGKEKKTRTYLLVSADSVADANIKISNLFKESLFEWKIEGVVDSKIVDYIPHTEVDED